jgi:hypothetical protein
VSLFWRAYLLLSLTPTTQVTDPWGPQLAFFGPTHIAHITALTCFCVESVDDDGPQGGGTQEEKEDMKGSPYRRMGGKKTMINGDALADY